MINHDAAVGAMVHSILLECCANSEIDPLPLANRIASFVLQQRRAMPIHTGLAVSLLTGFLDFWQIFRFGKPFHRLAHPQRQLVMAGWRLARRAPCNELLRLHEALTLFAWHTRDEEKHDGD